MIQPHRDRPVLGMLALIAAIIATYTAAYLWSLP